MAMISLDFKEQYKLRFFGTDMKSHNSKQRGRLKNCLLFYKVLHGQMLNQSRCD
ncbi:hypothetical protein HOLleu_34388 [Holothuria leucospilota]|uniref:Uncharacterized protein n=1 Tax=Holothuria leucospilota TaxID=206669 RepID=A0A9Q0YKZ3_HOLLE|nr:hypothetical protein HOLleu_34388 [Holothuria leucospilota]